MSHPPHQNQIDRSWSPRAYSVLSIGAAIGEALPLTHIITHLEPLEDPLSLDDRDLDRIITTDR